jgi:hypothetical protein
MQRSGWLMTLVLPCPRLHPHWGVAAVVETPYYWVRAVHLNQLGHVTRLMRFELINREYAAHQGLP